MHVGSNALQCPKLPNCQVVDLRMSANGEHTSKARLLLMNARLGTNAALLTETAPPPGSAS